MGNFVFDLWILCLKVKVCLIMQIYFVLIIMRRIIKKLKNFYRVVCSEYRKFEKREISNILEKTLILSIICSKHKNEDEKIFKEK